MITSEEIINRFGGPSEVAKLCECTPQAVSQWYGKDAESGDERDIPKARLMFLKILRPDLFLPEISKESAKDSA